VAAPQVSVRTWPCVELLKKAGRAGPTLPATCGVDRRASSPGNGRHSGCPACASQQSSHPPPPRAQESHVRSASVGRDDGASSARGVSWSTRCGKSVPASTSAGITAAVTRLCRAASASLSCCGTVHLRRNCPPRPPDPAERRRAVLVRLPLAAAGAEPVQGPAATNAAAPPGQRAAVHQAVAQRSTAESATQDVRGVTRYGGGRRSGVAP